MTPDALFVDESIKSGATLFQRVASVCRYAEPILGADRANGELVYFRKQPNGRLFITRSMDDTIYFPTGHPRSGQQRYRWERQLDGSEHGFLVEGANDVR